MDALADILKNLTISKTLIAAVFVTTTFMYGGPILVPDGVPKLKHEFIPYLFAAMILSGCLLIFWGVAAFWNLTRISTRSLARVFADSTLSELEIAFLIAMARDPIQPMNFDEIDYSRAPGTKLAFHHWAKQLQIKGLARINEWDDNLVSLTDQGRDRALKIQSEAKKGNAG